MGNGNSPWANPHTHNTDEIQTLKEFIEGAGVQGPPGPQGEPGPQGPAGADSEVPGPQGEQGPPGADGVPGPKGDPGDQGQPGNDGAPGAQGDQGPPGEQGLKGDQGDPGAQGDQGIQGIPGENGAPGAQGEQGIQGIQGDVGPQGYAGNDGAPGPQGDQGIQGIQGVPGNDGAPGAQGEQGTQGIQGIQGIQGVAGVVSTLRVPLSIPVLAATIWTNMPAALSFFLSTATVAKGVERLDLTGYTQVRLRVNKQGTSGAAASKLILRYKTTTFTQAVSDYSDIGTSEVSVAVNVNNTYLDTGWINLAAGAKADIFLALLGSGGDGALDPAFGQVVAEFK